MCSIVAIHLQRFTTLENYNVQHSISTLKTPYQEAADFVINNTEGEDVHLKSAEGATQEDVVAMPMNGISIQPLIDQTTL